jgi:hypothetical protein
VAWEDEEIRSISARLEAIESRLAGKYASGPDSGPCWVGKIVSGGNFPTSLPAVCLVQADRLDFPNAEGAAVSLTPTGEPIEVLVLGSSAPAVGERMLVSSCADSWIGMRA